MANDERNLETIPTGALGLIPLASCTELGEKVNQYLVKWRDTRHNEVGDASRYIYEYGRRAGYDLPPYPLAGCGEIRGFFADQGVRTVPEWYERILGVDERAYARLPAWTIVVVRDREGRRKALFLDGIRYRNAAAFENLADSGIARTLSENDLGELLDRLLAFLVGDDALAVPASVDAGPWRGSSLVF